MLALIAGTGELPRAVVEAQEARPFICGLRDSPPDRVIADHLFRLEQLGALLRVLKRKGVTEICFCGGIARPTLKLTALGLSTLRFVPRILRALRRGDDGALRIAIGLFEAEGFIVLAAHDAAPGLLPAPGVPSLARPGGFAARLADCGDQISVTQAREDLGQACVIARSGEVTREQQDGTDALLARVGRAAPGGVLYKAPKPGQDRRADLPVIGPGTAAGAAKAGLTGIVIEAGGVMVLNYAETLRRLDAEGMFLWVRERPN